MLLFVHFQKTSSFNTPILLNFRTCTACPCLNLQVFGITEFFLPHVVNSYHQHLQQSKEAYWPALHTFLQVATLPAIHCSPYMCPSSDPTLSTLQLLEKDINLIEDVKKLTLKVYLKSWTANYQELLHSNLPTLQVRSQAAKLCHFYKIIKK